ncbi:MAG: hypothetical protein AAFR17_03040 [Pseudomonadota bacterium]
MSETDAIDDAALVRVLDGTASPAQARRVAEACAQDPALQAKRDAMSVDIGDIRAGMDAVLLQAPEMTLPQAERTWRPIWQAAAAVLIFAVGLAAGRLLPGDGYGAEADWHQAVADYQVLYTTATLTTSPLPRQMRDAGLSRTAAALGLDLTPERVATSDMTFQRAQILQIDGAPLAQLVYLDANSQPIAFCITRRDGPDTAPVTRQFGRQTARIWQQGGYGFILIGPVAETSLIAATRELSEKIAL